MKITLNQDPAFPETEIIINCPQADEDILRLVAMLRIHQHKLVGLWQGESHLLDIRDILYIDTADKRTFLYTREKVYESALRLYELEERLESSDFFRASKSLIINFNQIQSLKPEFGGTMQVTMSNGERLTISRQYAKTVKEKLGCL